MYCPATTAQVSVTPDDPTVAYASLKFLVVDATADALPDPLVSDGEIRVSVPAPHDPYSPTAEGAAIVLYCYETVPMLAGLKCFRPYSRGVGGFLVIDLST